MSKNMSSVVIETQPKRSQIQLNHSGKSMGEIADDYFCTISPIGRKIISEKRKCTDSHRRDWDHLTQTERDNILDDWFIDPTLKLKYELKFGKKKTDVPLPVNFPRLKLEGSGERIVHYSTEHEDHQDGPQPKETVSWKDEFSGPFCWETKSQQEMSINTSESITTSSIPSPISHDLIKVSDPNDESDAEWFAKANKDKNKLSVMLMRDVNTRDSLGNNLLASSSEKLVFDQAVNEAQINKQKPFKKKEDKITSNERKQSIESLEKKKKNPKWNITERPKVPPPTADKMKTAPPSLEKIKTPTSSNTIGNVRSSVKEAEKPSEVRQKPSLPTNTQRPDGDSKSSVTGTSRRDETSMSRDGGKRQLLPSNLMTELKQELRIQDNTNFDSREEVGQGDVKTEIPQDEDESKYEFLFDW